MMVTNCSGERSFSKLALIKNHFKTSITDERFSALCLLDVESSVIKKKTHFDDLVKEFTEVRCRRREFL